MPTTLPTPFHAPTDGATERRRILRAGVLLSVLLALPILGLIVLNAVLSYRCTTHVQASGVLVAKTLWRIERKVCAGANDAFYDVLIGVEGKAFASALTGRGAPFPVSVSLAGDGRAVITLSGPVGESQDQGSVNIRLRRSGSPAERIDLEKMLAGRSAPAGKETGR